MNNKYRTHAKEQGNLIMDIVSLVDEYEGEIKKEISMRETLAE